MNFRIEKDTMGEIKVANDKYWQAQTQRSLENFPIGDEKMPKEIIEGFAYLKKACAIVNNKLKRLDDIKTDDKFTLPIDEEYKYRINLLGLKTVWAVPPLVKQSSLDESNNTNSGQDQRDKEGLKKYIYWRQNIYKLFPKKFKKKIYKLEEKVKKIMLGIK